MTQQKYAELENQLTTLPSCTERHVFTVQSSLSSHIIPAHIIRQAECIKNFINSGNDIMIWVGKLKELLYKSDAIALKRSKKDLSKVLSDSGSTIKVFSICNKKLDTSLPEEIVEKHIAPGIYLLMLDDIISSHKDQKSAIYCEHQPSMDLSLMAQEATYGDYI